MTFKVIEMFSGIGSQAKALRRVKNNIEVIGTVEWDINAIVAYDIMHNGNQIWEQNNHESIDEIKRKLIGIDLSINGKKPMEHTSLLRFNEETIRRIYSAIQRTKNYGSITKINGEELPNNIDLITYSFPCQDLSLAGSWHGNSGGISRDANNRSGMLWEVERILLEMREAKKMLPKFLLMENVSNILSKKHEGNFNEWKSQLEELGYTNKVWKLNSKNFGIPQSRERVFMLSILTQHSKRIENKVNQYLDKHDLSNQEKQENTIMLTDILKTDYSIKKYKIEAARSQPNNTKSRKKIREENKLLFDYRNGTLVELVSTLTTKQDRHPNSGVIEYKSQSEGKADFRYLTSRECFLLMGFDEEDYDLLLNNNFNMGKSNNKMFFSNEKMLKMAGNSIVVNVLEAIFIQMFEIEEMIMKK